MRSRITIRRIISMFFGLFLFGTALSNAFTFAQGDRIVAVVNSEAITQGDVDEFLNALYFQLYSEYDPQALEEKMKEAKTEAVDMLVENQLMIQEAKRQELKVSDDRVDNDFEDIKARFSSQKEFEEGLAAKGLSIAEFKKKIANKLLMHDIVEKEVRSKIFVHPKEVTEYYAQHPEDFKVGEQLDLDSMFIPFSGDEAKAKEKAYVALALLKKGEDFYVVQKEYSQMSSLGVVKPGQLRKEVQDALKNLAVAEISLPIRVEDGFFILKIKERTPERIKELSEVKDVISGYLFQKKFEERYIGWIDELKAKAFILIK